MLCIAFVSQQHFPLHCMSDLTVSVCHIHPLIFPVLSLQPQGFGRKLSACTGKVLFFLRTETKETREANNKIFLKPSLKCLCLQDPSKVKLEELVSPNIIFMYLCLVPISSLIRHSHPWFCQINTGKYWCIFLHTKYRSECMEILQTEIYKSSCSVGEARLSAKQIHQEQEITHYQLRKDIIISKMESEIQDYFQNYIH